MEFEFRGDIPEVIVGDAKALPLDLTLVAEGVLSADVSLFAGTANTLRFRAPPGVITTIDNVRFIPEPTSGLSAGLAAVLLFGFARRR